MTKNEIRKKNLKLRYEIENRNCLDEKIQKTLFLQDFFKNAKTVMTYVSYKSEPDTLKIIEKMLSEGKTVCAPVCLGGGIMETYELSSLSELSPSNMGILEPKREKKIAPSDIDLLIVPLCAFNKDGHRIGYGGGYYDRFLSKTDIITVGLCYADLEADFKGENHDKPLKYIITEKGIYSF